MIKVLIVDDQMLVRQGIHSLLSLADDVEVVAEAADGVEALQRIAEHRPDVMLLDLRMPVLDGIGTLQRLAHADHHPAVLVLTTFDDDDEALRALRAGARGYLLKDVSLEGLLEGIRTLASGGRHIQPTVSARLVDRLVSAGTTEPATHVAAEPLTIRELEVLRLMAAGWSNREIAQGLHLAEGTVKNHVSTVLLKLGVRDRTRAVLRALEAGLLDNRGQPDLRSPGNTMQS